MRKEMCSPHFLKKGQRSKKEVKMKARVVTMAIDCAIFSCPRSTAYIPQKSSPSLPLPTEGQKLYEAAIR